MTLNPSSHYLKKFGLPGIIIILLAGIGVLIWWQSGATPSPPQSRSSGIGKLTIQDTGMYRLTTADLESLGLPIDPADLRLYNLGQLQPLWFNGNQDNLEIYFFGQALDTPYTNQNVYFLTTQDNIPPDTTITFPDVQTSLPLPVRLEENLLYFPKAEPEQTWYWKNLTAPSTEAFDFTLTNLAAGEGHLRFSFYANTNAANINPDHHIRLFINQIPIAEKTWDGQGGRVLNAFIPDGTLQPGPNTLTIELPGDTGVAVESILLDWFEIQYPQKLVAENNHAVFVGAGSVVEIGGFRAPPLVFDLTPAGQGGVPIRITPISSFHFHTQPNHSYFAVGPEGFLHPTVSSAQLTPDLRSVQASYLAIGPPDLLQPLQPLLDHRSLERATLPVPIEAVYDQFGGGLAHPEAIRSYLKFAYQFWETPPEYLLLVGDSTYDPRGYQTPPVANRVPSFFRFTIYGGETSSDILFAQLDDDFLPDLAVGRIPARTSEQVKIIVEKTLGYELGNLTEESPVPHRILAIADGQEASFITDAETFLGNFPDAYAPILLAPLAGDNNTPLQISAVLDEGVLFMSYFGHGSITMLGKDRIFSVEDGEKLENGQHLPIMVNITCLAGLFTHPEAESLTEVMLWNKDGGAVAALSATSLTLPSDQAFLSKAFVEALVQNPESNLGKFLLSAQRSMPVENVGVLEVMETFLLFGDPALKLPISISR